MVTARQTHAKEYDENPDIIVDVPSSYTFVGAYADYCNGPVISAAGEKSLKVAISFRDDAVVRLYNAALNDKKHFALGAVKYRREDRWANFFKGVVNELQKDGRRIDRGLNVSFSGDLLAYDGIVGVTALCLGSLMALGSLFHMNFSREEYIRYLFGACARFNGRYCRISDIETMLNAEEEKLLIFDLQRGSYEKYDFPFKQEEGNVCIVVESNIPHQMLRDEMNEKRRTAEHAFKILRSRMSISTLREMGDADLMEQLGCLDSESSHVCSYIFTESRLAREAAAQLVQKEPLQYGRIMNRIQMGMRDQMEISCPEVDWLAKRASETPGCHGANIVANGINGTLMVLLTQTGLNSYLERLEEYERIFGFHPDWRIFVPRGGASVHSKINA
ncbi:galactokinase [Parasphaerochaeta coccoides]|uniref:Galactokinase n=1 Tax=Parasphaerochaeta coccoides (strain ATCC BAA-1237 / DSM 17374 / SPN1) TaxID=760011 RepID=F4GLP9_PARC1|nr:galactokinase [Parasphaerochaeta coccoides]AEC02443.1 Galactokinase [Parasphaerochaeta coccoides DSM 17374]